jgi:hypothetical protein
VRALREHGWRVLAVPLNHDQALSDVLPYLVRVLIERPHRQP